MPCSQRQTMLPTLIRAKESYPDIVHRVWDEIGTNLPTGGTTTISSFSGHKAMSRCFCIVQKNEPLRQQRKMLYFTKFITLSVLSGYTEHLKSEFIL